jgi:hypothetical protein
MRKVQSSWILEKESLSLVSNASITAKRVALVLGRIEDGPHAHLVFNTASSQLDVEMPRLKIGFSLKSGSNKLRFQQFRGMYVDPVQRNSGQRISIPESLGHACWRDEGSKPSTKRSRGD